MRRFALIIVAMLFGIALKAQSVTYTCRYWFDQNHTQAVTTTFSDSIWQTEIDVGSLTDGLHTLYIHVMDTSMKWSAPKDYLFFKVDETLPENYLYHCWFDQDFDNQQSDVIGDGSFLLDVADIDEGLHTVNVIVEGYALTSTKCYLFFKMPVEDPNIEQQYICWFDDDYSTMQTGLLGIGSFLLDVNGLSSGLHVVNVQLKKGTTLTSSKCYFFIKTDGIEKWEYCINGNWENRITTEVELTDTLDVVGLLPVETQPIRSMCFQFHPNGDTPEIFAKNEITFRFWDSGKHFKDQSKLYVDENVVEVIQANTLERNSTETMLAPRNNQITWFKLDAGVGDSLVFVADKACTMQLFAPSGEEVYSATASEAIVFGGCHAWEDGIYYLAVHDVTGSGETISVTYNWIYKYAILAYDVHLVGNGGCSTITFQGNGFNSLLDVYLVNYQNDTIHRLDIGHESNTTTTVTFDFYQVNLGTYDAVFQFYGETIRVNGALEVQEPVDILLTSSVSYPSQFLRNTPCTYTYTITNNGNMSAYRVPIFLYISTDKSDDVMYVKLDGIELPTLLDGIGADSLSEQAVFKLKELSDSMGDLHHFFAFQSVDEVNGDSISIMSDYFFLNLAPFESKTIKIIVKTTFETNKSLNVWMTVPNEVVYPLVLAERGFKDQYCCVKDKIECVLNITADISGLLSKLPGAWGVAAKITDCVTSSLSFLSSSIGYWVCREEGDPLPFDHNSVSSTEYSAMSCIMKCFKKYPDIFDQLMNLFEGKGFGTMKELCGIAQDIQDCVKAFTQVKPGCPRGDPEGGPSTPVNSLDPNDIHGYLSESGSHYMRREIQNVQYEIEFENDTTLATAAAHTIIVRDTLDATKFDLNSLAARSVTIGDKRLDLNGERTFARTLDLRPDIYVIAQVEQDYDPTTGIIQWAIQSLDPMTMEPTDDPYQGVLPVNYYGNGVGFIDYSINLKQVFADGTEISNRAGIIFDQEEVIMTPTWTNIVDAVKPTSHIEQVVPVADSLSFSFVSEDNRSGVWYHTLYQRNDSTQMEWQVKKPQIIGNEFMLQPELMTTEYLVMAVDSAGNREEKEMVAEYIYYYDGPAATTQTSSLAAGWNWWSTYIEQNGIDGMGMLQNSLGHNGLTIKSQNDFTDNFYQDMGEDYWYGSLETITNENGYLINVLENGNASLTGVVANTANHPITIQPNWNWIGYPVATPQAVTIALADFSPMADDVVKGQSDFTSYYEGFGWYPDDFMLIPGQSYLYFSNASANKTLTYSGGGRGGVLKNGKAEKPFWKNDVHAFADNLNVMAVVSINNEEQRDENLVLGAFVNGECRGSARLSHFAPQDRYLAMLTVSGQEGELVEFRLVHTESLEMNEVCANHLVFSKNAIVGSLGKPYEIRFGDDVEVTGNMAIYPNPVESGKTFSLNVPQGETITEVVISDVLGNQLRHETGALNPKAVKGLPTAGVYVIKSVAKSGNTYYGRLIVE